jgi:hypothetical protein
MTFAGLIGGGRLVQPLTDPDGPAARRVSALLRTTRYTGGKRARMIRCENGRASHQDAGHECQCDEPRHVSPQTCSNQLEVRFRGNRGGTAYIAWRDCGSIAALADIAAAHLRRLAGI